MNKNLVLIACFLTVFIAYAIRYGYGLLLPEMLKTMGITKTDAGIIFSSFFIAYTLGAPVCGFISDRYGSRWLLGTCVIAMGTGALLMAYVHSILEASLFFMLAGIGAAACWAPVVGLVQKWTSRERRGLTLSFIDIGSALSISSTGVLVPIIVKNFDWRAGWVILGITGIIIGVLNLLLIRNPPETLRATPLTSPTNAAPASIPVPVLIKSGKFWLFSLSYLFIGIAYVVPFTFLSTYAVQELSLSYVIAANIMTVLGIGAMVSKLTIGPLSDKTGRLKMILLCGLLIGLGNLAMVFHHTVTVFIAAIIFSMGYGAIWAMYGAAASDYFNQASAGTIVGIWTLFLGIGSTLSPVISGWLADATQTLTWSFVTGGTTGLIGIILLIPLSKKVRV